MIPKGLIVVVILLVLWLASDARAAGPNPHDIVDRSRVKKETTICADVEELTCTFGEPIDQLEGG